MKALLQQNLLKILFWQPKLMWVLSFTTIAEADILKETLLANWGGGPEGRADFPLQPTKVWPTNRNAQRRRSPAEWEHLGQTEGQSAALQCISFGNESSGLSHTHTHTLGFHKDTLPRSHAHRVVYVIYQVYACWPGRKSVSVCEWPNRVLPTALPGCQRLNPRPEDTTLLPARRPTTSPFWRQRIGCRTTGDRTTNHQSNRGLCALSRPYEGPKARHPGPQPETPSRLSIS